LDGQLVDDDDTELDYQQMLLQIRQNRDLDCESSYENLHGLNDPQPLVSFGNSQHMGKVQKSIAGSIAEDNFFMNNTQDLRAQI
jgi:hypothetical protein